MSIGNAEMETRLCLLFSSASLTGVSSLHIRFVQLCPGSSPSETLGSERPSRRFAPLAPCPHRAAKCKGKCLCLLLIQHAPTSRAEHAGRNVPFGSPRRPTWENVPSNERAIKRFLRGGRKAIAGRSVSLYASCGPAAIADLSAAFGPLRCCHVVWQSSTDVLPECTRRWCNDAICERDQARGTISVGVYLIHFVTRESKRRKGSMQVNDVHTHV